MSARLLRFYGRHPDGDWLKDVEGRVFRAHVQMLPRLRAEEALAAIQEGHAFVERPLEQHARRGYVDRLEKERQGVRDEPNRIQKMSLGQLRNMGIPVQVQGDAKEVNN